MSIQCIMAVSHRQWPSLVEQAQVGRNQMDFLGQPDGLTQIPRLIVSYTARRSSALINLVLAGSVLVISQACQSSFKTGAHVKGRACRCESPRGKEKSAVPAGGGTLAHSNSLAIPGSFQLQGRFAPDNSW